MNRAPRRLHVPHLDGHCDGAQQRLRSGVARHCHVKSLICAGWADERVEDWIDRRACKGTCGVEHVACVCVHAVAVGIEPQPLVGAHCSGVDRGRALEVVDNGSQVECVRDTITRHVTVHRVGSLQLTRQHPLTQRSPLRRRRWQHSAPCCGEGHLAHSRCAWQKVHSTAACELELQAHGAAGHSRERVQRYSRRPQQAPARPTEAGLHDARVHDLRPLVVACRRIGRIDWLRHEL